MRTLSRRTLAAGITIGLCALILAIYGQAVKLNAFVLFDDNILITENPTAQELSWRSVSHAFTSYDPELYIPLTLLSYQLTAAFFGVSATAFHAVNLLLHAINAACVFAVVTKLLSNWRIGIIASVLFAVHPLHAEAVLWASARKDLLSATAALLTLFAFLQYRTSGLRRWYAGASIFFAVALLSKVSVAALPVFFLVHDWMQRRSLRASLLHAAPFFVLSMLAGIVALYGKAVVLGAPDAWESILLACKGIVLLGQKLLWPSSLAVAYLQYTPISIFSAEFFLPLLFIVALVGVCAVFLVQRRQTTLVVAVLLFLLLVLPSTLNTMKNGFLFITSDRYAYLASIGPALLAGRIADLALQRWRMAAVTGICAIVAVLAWQAHRQSLVWKDTKTLFTHLRSVDTRSALAANTLAALDASAGETDTALSGYREAVALQPGYIRAMVNIANLLRSTGRQDEALAAYRDAVQAVGTSMPVTPDALNAYYEYAQFLLQRGQEEEAYEQLQHATAWNLPHGEAFYNLAIVADGLGKSDEAFAALKTSVDYSPHFVPALYVLAGWEAERGMLAEAERHLQRVVRLAPGYEQAERHLERIRTLW